MVNFNDYIIANSVEIKQGHIKQVSWRETISLSRQKTVFPVELTQETDMKKETDTASDQTNMAFQLFTNGHVPKKKTLVTELLKLLAELH